MRWRPLHLVFLLFQVFWLNVVVPGHTRGIVLLPGASCEACHRPLLACCARHAKAGGHESSPPAGPTSQCAICFFAARLTLPPVVDFTLPPLGLAEILDPPAPLAAPSRVVALTCDERAPPCHI